MNASAEQVAVLEQRITALERQVRELRLELAARAKDQGWPNISPANRRAIALETE